MSKVLIIIKGGVIQEIHSDSSDIEIFAADYDNPSFEEFGSCDLENFDEFLEEIKEEITEKEN